MGKEDGLTSEQRCERDAKALQEKLAKKTGQGRQPLAEMPAVKRRRRIDPGVSSNKDSEAQISVLESIMGSKVFIVEDRAELQIFAPSAKEVTRYYDAPKFRYEDLKYQLEDSFAKIDASLVNLQESPSNQFQDTCDLVKETRASISKCSSKILYCLDTLGVICAWEILQHLISAFVYVN